MHGCRPGSGLRLFKGCFGSPPNVLAAPRSSIPKTASCRVIGVSMAPGATANPSTPSPRASSVAIFLASTLVDLYSSSPLTAMPSAATIELKPTKWPRPAGISFAKAYRRLNVPPSLMSFINWTWTGSPRRLMPAQATTFSFSGVRSLSAKERTVLERKEFIWSGFATLAWK